MRIHLGRRPLAVALLTLATTTLLTVSVAQATQEPAPTDEPVGRDAGFCLTLPVSQADPGFGRDLPGGTALDPGFYVDHPAVCAPAPETEPAGRAPEPVFTRLLTSS